MDFSGKVAIITGAASGIGREVAEQLATAGANVALLDTDCAGLEGTASRISHVNGRRLFLETDVSSETSVALAFERIRHEWHRIDMLINVAGLEFYKEFVEVDEHEWDAQINCNLKSIYLCSRHAVQDMIVGGGGVIVNTASVQALATTGRTSAYAAAKAGILGLTRDLARDLGPHNIRVNSICPGCIATPMMDRTLELSADPIAARERMRTSIPLRRLGQPKDIANVILFLVSPYADYVSGVALVVDGGLMTKIPLPD